MHNNKNPHPSRKPLARAILSVLALSGASAKAAEQAIETINVLASPIVAESRVDAFGSVTAQISEAQLRDQNALDLASALRRTPGVQISRFNPVGSFGGGEGGAVYIRGMGVSRPGSEIKSYVDGVPFYMGTWNHPLLDLLPINAMSSIVVHKGPQPQISGNNFASVNLQTRRASEEGVAGDMRVTAGSFHTFTEQLTLTAKQGRWDALLAQGAANSDGHRDNAQGQLRNLMGRVGLQIDDVWSAGVTVLSTDNEAQDPGDERVVTRVSVPEYNTQATLVSAVLAHTQEDWSGEIKAYRSGGSGDWLAQPANTFTDFETSGLIWNERLQMSASTELVFGADSHRVSGDVVESAAGVNIDTGTFRLDSWHFALARDVVLNDSWTLTPSIGARGYSHSEFDGATTPHAGLTLNSERLMLYANLAEGVNYPGLEAPVLAAYIRPLGNSWQRLAAEELDHKEIGGTYALSGATSVSASLFEDDVSNRYVFGFPPLVAPPPQFLNLGSYEISGTELALSHEASDALRVFAALTSLDTARDDLPYTPERAFTAGLNAKIGAWTLVVDAQYQSKILAMSRARAAGAPNTQELKAFTVVNARLSHPLSTLGAKGEIFLAGENLLDREYQFQPGYPMPGTGLQVGVSASF
jgi:outer membrane cobalamin receptor